MTTAASPLRQRDSLADELSRGMRQEVAVVCARVTLFPKGR
jgi:hypothetical protein